jgi:hypothetical protein
MKMLGGVPVLRGIAAADMPACEAQTKVHPPVPHLQTFFAAFRMRLDIFDLIQMLTLIHFRCFSPLALDRKPDL